LQGSEGQTRQHRQSRVRDSASNSIDALTAAGLDWEKDLKAEGVKAAEAPGLLQDGRIDAFFYTVGHPSGAIKEATAGATKVQFVTITKCPTRS
jgi:TRAP-type uncharacterized transport system substrate-binding protein